MDAGIALIHVIWSGWVKNKTTSILAFDIAQFFPSLNHHILTLFLKKAGLDLKVISFFMDFLVRRKTNYIWNDFSFQTYEVNVGVGQESTLSPILSALYLSPFLYILEKHLKNLNISVSLISFVDDGLIISQNKSIDISNSQLFCNYNPDFSSSLDLTSSIQKLKCSILTDPMEHSILLLSISHQLEDQFFTPKAYGSTWSSYLTESLCSISTLTSIRTKPSL